jgi:hypothetical protein
MLYMFHHRRKMHRVRGFESRSGLAKTHVSKHGGGGILDDGVVSTFGEAGGAALRLGAVEPVERQHRLIVRQRRYGSQVSEQFLSCTSALRRR